MRSPRRYPRIRMAVDRDADAAYLELNQHEVTRTVGLGHGVNVDLGHDGAPVGYELVGLQTEERQPMLDRAALRRSLRTAAWFVTGCERPWRRKKIVRMRLFTVCGSDEQQVSLFLSDDEAEGVRRLAAALERTPMPGVKISESSDGD